MLKTDHVSLASLVSFFQGQRSAVSGQRIIMGSIQDQLSEPADL